MKQPNALLKVAAVVSSVLLAGGFVAYRAGAFTWIRGNSARPAPAQSSHTLETDPELFSSSKSSRIFITTIPSKKPAPDDLTIMGGSKSDIMISPDSLGTEVVPAVIEAPAPTIMGGSKSLSPLIPSSPPAKKGDKTPSTSPPAKPAP